MSDETEENTPAVKGGMYGQFKTDENLETKGVEIDYGTFCITLARAGGANKRYSRVLERLTKPHRRALATETMDPDRAAEILRESYAEAIVLKWETKVDGAFKPGIEAKSGGKLLPVNVKNIMETFANLPDLFTDIQTMANQIALFREEILEDDAGN